MVTKTETLKLATQQSQAAQRVTRHMRAHGWEFSFNGSERVYSDDDYRRKQAQAALDWARQVERDARAIRSHVEAWAKTQGAS